MNKLVSYLLVTNLLRQGTMRMKELDPVHIEERLQALPVTTGMSLQGQVSCVTIGRWLHGQAAITVLNEQVAIPTAIAAATVSFLIVILTSFLIGRVDV